MVDPCPEVIQPWWEWYPSVGICIAVLAGLGVLVPWFKGSEITGKGKAFWTFVMVALVALELRSIRLDGLQHDRDQARSRCQEEQRFREIAEKLEASVKASQDQFQTTLDEFAETLNTETGGDTFCYVDFNISPYAWMNGIPTKESRVRLALVRKGKYPLRDINLSITDEVKEHQILTSLYEDDLKREPNATNTELLANSDQASRESVTILPTQSLNVNAKSLPSMPAMDGDFQEFTVRIKAFNIEEMDERVTMVRVKDHWAKAILLEMNQKGRLDWFKIDPDFPRRNGHLDVDWPRHPQHRDAWDH